MVLMHTISVLGTGDFGRALAKSLLQGGFQVVVGSRRPGHRNLAACDPALEEARVAPMVEAIHESDVIFLALHPEAQAQLSTLEEHLAGKILVDVSNVTKKDKVSNAEKLQSMLPKSMVVKAFNTQSAYTIMTGYSSGNRDVYVAANDQVARQAVIEVAQRMGFSAISSGGLHAARELETMTTTLFRGWGAPLIVSLIVFAFWFTYGTVRYHYIKDHEWSRVPMNTMNKAQGCTSITLLAFCFLPGCFAAFAQLVYGTKHRRFAPFLDRWLKMRKELGLLALWTAVVHTVLSLAQLNPGYYAKWYGESEVYIPGDNTEDIMFKLSPRMTWIGECVVAFGTFSLGLMVILGITSLPSVGSRMNWRQWTFVQSYLGHACLLLAAVHVSFNACPSWSSTPFEKTVQKLSFLSLLVPYLTLFLRFVLVLPCFSIVLWKIRRGWECCQRRDPENVPMQNAASVRNTSSQYSPTTNKKVFSFDNVGFSTEENENKVQTL